MSEIAQISRKEQIEQIATALFHDKGYVGTSMRDLAAGLGIEAASIYSHIKSKEEILQRICFRMADEFIEMRRIVEGQSGSSIEKLKAALKGHALVVAKNTEAATVFFNEYKHMTDPHLTDFLAMRHDYEEWFRRMITEGMRLGEMREVDAKFTALTILSSANFISNWFNPEGKMTAEEVAERLARLLIEGLINQNT